MTPIEQVLRKYLTFESRFDKDKVLMVVNDILALIPKDSCCICTDLQRKYLSMFPKCPSCQRNEALADVRRAMGGEGK